MTKIYSHCMVDLTLKQSELLYTLTEVHLEWYKKYYEDPPPYDVLLELNHTKMNYMFEDRSHVPEAEITGVLQRMPTSYEDLLKNYS